MSAALAGAAGGLLGGGLQWGAATAEGNKAWRRQKIAMQNAMQWRVTDLRRAGLNPILAATGGVGGGGAPSVATAPIPDLSQSASSAATALGELARKKREANASIQLAETASKLNREKQNSEKLTQNQIAANTLLTAQQVGSTALDNERKTFENIVAGFDAEVASDKDYRNAEKRRRTMMPGGWTSAVTAAPEIADRAGDIIAAGVQNKFDQVRRGASGSAQAAKKIFDDAVKALSTIKTDQAGSGSGGRARRANRARRNRK